MLGRSTFRSRELSGGSIRALVNYIWETFVKFLAFQYYYLICRFWLLCFDVLVLLNAWDFTNSVYKEIFDFQRHPLDVHFTVFLIPFQFLVFYFLRTVIQSGTALSTSIWSRNVRTISPFPNKKASYYFSYYRLRLDMTWNELQIAHENRALLNLTTTYSLMFIISHWRNRNGRFELSWIG